MRRRAVLALGLSACTSASLERIPEPPPPPIDNRISVGGRFCTADPQAVEFPVKLLFIVDTSGSMAITDPPNPSDANLTGRARAVIEVIDALSGRPGVEIGILRFHSSVNDLTNGFRPDLKAEDVALLTSRAASLDSATSQTNYLGALQAAYQLLVHDVRAADDLKRARSRYSIMFLSDGLPDPPVATDDLVAIVRDLVSFGREQRLAELKLHTVYLGGATPPAFREQPIALLRRLADTGGGVFRDVENGERINFLDIGVPSFRRRFLLTGLFVRNENVRPLRDIRAATDSDGDGLSDAEELRIGTNPTKADTDGDGFSDALEHRLQSAGFDPLDPTDADCAIVGGDDFNRRDDDGDGLRNCEERFLGTSQKLFDTDADGMPDGFEVAAGTNPVAGDAQGDDDLDGASNLIEVRSQTDPKTDDRADFAEIGLRYDVQQVSTTSTGQSCFAFSVDNVRLAPTKGSTPESGGWNTIWLSFGQAPADDPHGVGEFRLACARARYTIETDQKLPPSGRIELTSADFHRPADLRREVDCVGP